MKLQYVVPLEILRIMGSVSQIFDTKITYKTSLDVRKSRKTLATKHDGSLKEWYVFKALDKRISNLVSKTKMDKDLGCFCRFKKYELGGLKNSGEGLMRVCICVYNSVKKKSLSVVHIYAQREERRKF